MDNNNRPLDNMEEKRDFNPATEKTTLDNNMEKGGLNDGNPNVFSTPASGTERTNPERREGNAAQDSQQ